MTKIPTSKLDAVYRSTLGLLTKFFTKGWGKPENLRRLFEFRKVVSNRDECFKLIERDYPVTITKEQNLSDCRLLEGYFMSPLERYLPGIVPEVVQKAHFQVLMPLHWPQPGVKPMCLHLAGTGDHFFWRRRNLMVKPLLKEAGIGGIILENPFYGLRKPTEQFRSCLHNVSDIFVMGGCLILESLVLFHWCERNGLGPLGVTGLSMGGHMASLAATNWPKPLVLVPCLSWSTASAVFLQGVMSHQINWDLLEDQYLSDGVYREKLSKMVTIVDEAFLAGKKFARTYSETVDKTEPLKAPLETSTLHTKVEANVDIASPHPIVSSESKSKSEVTSSSETIRSTECTKRNRFISNEIEQSDEQLEQSLKELLKLRNDNKISQALYNKLNSKDKFELDTRDIEEINNLSDEDLKGVLLQCKSYSKQNPVEAVELPKLTATNDSEEITSPIIPVKQRNATTYITEDKSPPGSLQTALTTELPKDISLKRRPWHVGDLTSDFWLHLPFLGSGKKIDISKIHWRDREALQFMRGVMDECTHLSNFSVPYDTSLIIAVCAKHDAYVPREDVGTLEEIWPGAEVRYVDAGHVSAYILHQSLFRSCIKEAFERSKKKWKDGRHINGPTDV